MALNNRIHVDCERCSGSPRLWTVAEGGTIAPGTVVCSACSGTGRDAAVEARLAELAGRLREQSVEWRLIVAGDGVTEIGELGKAIYRQHSADLDALEALLLQPD